MHAAFRLKYPWPEGGCGMVVLPPEVPPVPEVDEPVVELELLVEEPLTLVEVPEVLLDELLVVPEFGLGLQ